MKRFLHLAASPRYERSHSREIADFFIKTFLNRYPDYNLWEVDLCELHLPDIDENLINARYKFSHPGLIESTGKERAVWEAVKDEFRRFNSADYILFSTPMWNFNLPYHLKHYIDFITQPNIAFEMNEDGSIHGLLQGRRSAVLYASGALYEDESMKNNDFVCRYFQTWGAFIELKIDTFNYGGHDLPIDHLEYKKRIQDTLSKYIENLHLS